MYNMYNTLKIDKRSRWLLPKLYTSILAIMNTGKIKLMIISLTKSINLICYILYMKVICEDYKLNQSRL